MPCQDNSRANTQRRFFEGPNSNAYLVWGKKHCEVKTPVVVLENVMEPGNVIYDGYFQIFFLWSPGTILFFGIGLFQIIQTMHSFDPD